ncbi:MAG: DUF87 domain-containing protein, partial [Methanobacteriota archaeon]
MSTASSAKIEASLKAMGYSEEACRSVPDLLSPKVRDILGRLPERRTVIEALRYISIAQNSHTTEGRSDGVEVSCCPAGILLLLQCDLVAEESWQGKRVIRTTETGVQIASALIADAIAALDVKAVAKSTPVIVPFLLAASSHMRYTEKTYPTAPPEAGRTFLEFVSVDNPVVHEEIARLLRALESKGLAVVASDYTQGPPAPMQFVLPNEWADLLSMLIGAYEPDAVRECLPFVENVRRGYLALARIGGQPIETAPEARETQADIAACLDRLRDSVQITRHDSEGGPEGLQYIVANEARFRQGLEELAGKIRRQVAARCSATPSHVSPGEEIAPVAPIVPDPPAESPEIVIIPIARSEVVPVGEGDPWKENVDSDSDEESAAAVPAAPALQWSTRDIRAAATEMGAASASPGALNVLLGLDPGCDRVFWSPGTLNNGHFIIIGGSGAGKTETIRAIATELDGGRYPVLMIDFHGDMAAAEGTCRSYRIREGSEYYFNPLELDPAFTEITPLRATSDFVDAISINFPTFGIQQRRSVKGVIKDAYRRAGITFDPSTWHRQVDFDDVEDQIMNCDDEAIPAYLEDLFDYKLFSGSKKISVAEILRPGITHVNLNALPENLRYLFADLFLRRLFYSLQALGEIPRGTEDPHEKFRLFVIVDEAKLLVSQKTGQKQVIKAVLNKYATEMRKFGVGLILASQLISHFNDEIL